MGGDQEGQTEHSHRIAAVHPVLPVAQQLHRIAQKNVVCASLGVGNPVPELPRVIGSHVDGRVIASLVDGDPMLGLTRVIGGPRPMQSPS